MASSRNPSRRDEDSQVQKLQVDTSKKGFLNSFNLWSIEHLNRSFEETKSEQMNIDSNDQDVGALETYEKGLHTSNDKFPVSEGVMVDTVHSEAVKMEDDTVPISRSAFDFRGMSSALSSPKAKQSSRSMRLPQTSVKKLTTGKKYSSIPSVVYTTHFT